MGRLLFVKKFASRILDKLWSLKPVSLSRQITYLILYLSFNSLTYYSVSFLFCHEWMSKTWVHFKILLTIYSFVYEGISIKFTGAMLSKILRQISGHPNAMGCLVALSWKFVKNIRLFRKDFPFYYLGCLCRPIEVMYSPGWSNHNNSELIVHSLRTSLIFLNSLKYKGKGR